jgi:hypothetical protein
VERVDSLEPKAHVVSTAKTARVEAVEGQGTAVGAEALEAAAAQARVV